MKRFMVYVVLALMFILGLVSFAVAAEGGTLGQAAMGFVGELLSIVAVVLMGFVTLALKKVAEYFNVKINADTQIMIEAAAHRAVSYVEERAESYVKHEISGLSTGKEKLDQAISHMVDAGVKISSDQAREFIEAAIARMSGVGSTGARTVKVSNGHVTNVVGN